MGDKMNINLSEETLRWALRENLQQARHVVTERYWMFNIHMLVAGTIFSVLSSINFSPLTALALMSFLDFFSIGTFLIFLKLNEELGNAVGAAQWISEKLRLIKPIRRNHKKEIGEAYIALPLPLSVSVHKTLNFILITMISVESSFIIGCTLLQFSTNFHKALIVVPIISFITIFYICFRYSKKIKKEAIRIRKDRIPKEILVKWPLEED